MRSCRDSEPRRAARAARVLSLAAFALALGLGAATARADVVHLKDGRAIEGRIVSDSPAAVELDTKFGRMRIERAKIERIEKKRDAAEELAFRLQEAKDDPAKLWDAAEFARQSRMLDRRKEILERVVELDPTHAQAQQALGRVQYDGRWYTPEALEKEKAAFAARMEAEGKVFHNGRWIPADSAKREQGLELYKDQWLPWRDIYRLQSAELATELLGFALETRTSEHFQLRSQLDEALATELLDLLEDGYRRFEEVFRPDAIEDNILRYYPIAVYVLPDPNAVSKFVEPGGYMDRMYNPPKGINERYSDANAFPIFFPRPLIVTSLGRHNRGSDSWSVSLRGYLTHFEGNLLARRFRRAGSIPGWVEAGMASYFEAQLNGFQTLTITEYTDFEHVQKWQEGWRTFPEWYGQMSKAEVRQQLPSLAELRARPVEELTGKELALSYFLVTWLMEEKPQQLVQYVREAYREIPNTRGQKTPEEKAFQEAFGSDLEAEWAEWAAANIPAHPGRPGASR